MNLLGKLHPTGQEVVSIGGQRKLTWRYDDKNVSYSFSDSQLDIKLIFLAAI